MLWYILLSLIGLWTIVWAAACIFIHRSEYSRHMTLSAYLLIYLLPVQIITSIPSRLKYPRYYKIDFDPKKDDWPGKRT